MAEFPAFPLWTDAYLGDTIHLTTIEHGAYLLLLMAMWRNDGKLPDDDRMLARYARMTQGQWGRVSVTIRAFFKAYNGTLTQGRLTDELNAVRQHSKRQSDRVKSRWLKTKEKVSTAVIPEVRSGNTPLPLPLTVREEREAKASPKKSVNGNDKNAAKFTEFWAAYPKKVGKPAAEKNFIKAIKDGADPDRIIEGAKRYAKSDQVARGFAKHPQGWITDQRWDDVDLWDNDCDPVRARYRAITEAANQAARRQ